jgi:hypothetical protein
VFVVGGFETGINLGWSNPAAATPRFRGKPDLSGFVYQQRI